MVRSGGGKTLFPIASRVFSQSLQIKDPLTTPEESEVAHGGQIALGAFLNQWGKKLLKNV